MFSNCNGIKMEVNKRSKTGKKTHKYVEMKQHILKQLKSQ